LYSVERADECERNWRDVKGVVVEYLKNDHSIDYMEYEKSLEVSLTNARLHDRN
jgi:hypothetical protein